MVLGYTSFLSQNSGFTSCVRPKVQPTRGIIATSKLKPLILVANQPHEAIQYNSSTMALRKKCVSCRSSGLRCNDSRPSCGTCSESGLRCRYDRNSLVPSEDYKREASRLRVLHRQVQALRARLPRNLDERVQLGEQNLILLNVQGELRDLQAANLRLQQQLRDLQASNRRLQQQLRDLQASNRRLQQQLRDLQASNLGLQQQLRGLQRESRLMERRHQQELQVSRQRDQVLRQDIQTLRDQVEYLQQEGIRRQVLDMLVELRNEN